MRLDPNPRLRRTITVWHASTVVYLVLMVLMLLVTLFGLVGIDVAGREAAYQPHRWVPWSLTVAAFILFVTATVRVVRRLLDEHYSGDRVDD